jgi:hypothetical protein
MTCPPPAIRALAAAAIAAGALVPTSIVPAGSASADPCYSADCVPNVARGVVEGAPCVAQPRRAFAYGLQPDGGTVVCSAAGVWVAAGPLIGVYNVSMPCPALNLSAQGSDGVALQCLDQGVNRLEWSHRASLLA